MGSVRGSVREWRAGLLIPVLALAAQGGVACGDDFSGTQPGTAGLGPADGGGRGGTGGRGGGSGSGGTDGSANGGASGGSASGGVAGAGASGGAHDGSATGGTAAGGSGTSGAASGGGSGAQGSGGAIDAGPIVCTGAAECPKPSSPCRLAACLDRTCSSIPLAPGVEPTQVPGDCLRLGCDTQGSPQTFADPTDVDDANECTTDACNGTTASHVARSGQSCSGGVCNAMGRCSRCLDASQCGTAPECMKYECVAGECTLGPAPAATFCHGFADQCNGAGVCVDCVNNGGCDECCVCDQTNTCIPA